MWYKYFECKAIQRPLLDIDNLRRAYSGKITKIVNTKPWIRLFNALVIVPRGTIGHGRCPPRSPPGKKLFHVEQFSLEGARGARRQIGLFTPKASGKVAQFYGIARRETVAYSFSQRRFFRRT